MTLMAHKKTYIRALQKLTGPLDLIWFVSFEEGEGHRFEVETVKIINNFLSTSDQPASD